MSGLCVQVPDRQRALVCHILPAGRPATRRGSARTSESAPRNRETCYSKYVYLSRHAYPCPDSTALPPQSQQPDGGHSQYYGGEPQPEAVFIVFENVKGRERLTSDDYLKPPFFSSPAAGCLRRTETVFTVGNFLLHILVAPPSTPPRRLPMRLQKISPALSVRA